MKIIGLTGGIATGKTTVARMLADLGAEIIDADQLSRDAVLPGSPVLEGIRKLFGEKSLMPDGSLNRKELRDLVFSVPEMRKQLEAIIHPAIKNLALEKIASARQMGAKVAVYMAPLLIEAGAADRVDEIWVVTLKPELQIERLMSRDHCDRETAKRIIDSQMPIQEKEKFARVLIDNSADLDSTRNQVVTAWQQRILS